MGEKERDGNGGFLDVLSGKKPLQTKVILGISPEIIFVVLLSIFTIVILVYKKRKT